MGGVNHNYEFNGTILCQTINKQVHLRELELTL